MLMLKRRTAIALSIATTIATLASGGTIAATADATSTKAAQTQDTGRALVILNGDPLSTYVKTKPAKGKTPTETAPAAGEPTAKPTPRAGTKQAQMIDMLRRPEGATVEQIAAATGWQHHTIRGAISGALKKKLGLTVEATRTREVGPNKTGAKGSATTYRIVG